MTDSNKDSLKTKSIKSSAIERERLDNFSDREDLEVDLKNKQDSKGGLFKFNIDDDDNKDKSSDIDDSENKDFVKEHKPLNKKMTGNSKKSFLSDENQDSDKSSKQKSSSKSHTSSSEDDSENKDKFEDDDSDQEQLPEFKSAEEVEEFFKELRARFKQKEREGQLDQESLWEDPEFVGDTQLFFRDGEMPKRFDGYEIQFERPNNSSDQGDPQKIEFFSTDVSNNINYQFKVKKGMLTDKFFVGCILMLFKSREEFFNNLVIDLENVNENIKFGFCGFQFFISGEWKYIVIDTNIPWHQTEEMALSSATSVKSSFWLTLICKAYAKVYRSFDVLNDLNVSPKNVLVDLTGGTSKKIILFDPEKDKGNDKPEILEKVEITDKVEKLDEFTKKMIFEDLKRQVHQGYLVGCMKWAPLEEDDPDETQSDNGEDEDILENSMYVFLDVQEVDGLKMIYLNNSWGKGKWSGLYNPEDENWETNKGLKEKLGYENQNDGTFWMLYEQWLQHFDTVYSCRIYPPNWYQFCIPGGWMGLTSGGAPLNYLDDQSKENQKEVPKQNNSVTRKDQRNQSVVNINGIQNKNILGTGTENAQCFLCVLYVIIYITYLKVTIDIEWPYKL